MYPASQDKSKNDTMSYRLCCCCLPCDHHSGHGLSKNFFPLVQRFFTTGSSYKTLCQQSGKSCNYTGFETFLKLPFPCSEYNLGSMIPRSLWIAPIQQIIYGYQQHKSWHTNMVTNNTKVAFLVAPAT